jgi:hypothetical protein
MAKGESEKIISRLEKQLKFSDEQIVSITEKNKRLNKELIVYKQNEASLLTNKAKKTDGQSYIGDKSNLSDINNENQSEITTEKNIVKSKEMDNSFVSVVDETAFIISPINSQYKKEKLKEELNDGPKIKPKQSIHDP